jgi:hypothetical protein
VNNEVQSAKVTLNVVDKDYIIDLERKNKKNLEKSWTNIAENEEAELRLLQDMDA